MKRAIIAFVMIALPAVIITSCLAAPTVTHDKAAKAPLAAARYHQLMREHVPILQNRTDAQLDDIGQKVCALFAEDAREGHDSGYAWVDVIKVLVTPPEVAPPDQAGELVVYAVARYCPDRMAGLPKKMEDS